MESKRFGYVGSRGAFRERGAATLARLVTIAASVLLLCAALVFSVLLFAVFAVGGLLAWGYVWWKMRRLPQAHPRQQTDGRLIEGEVIRDAGKGAEDAQR